ncbi:hypothetical protein [Spirosoma arcticum]
MNGGQGISGREYLSTDGQVGLGVEQAFQTVVKQPMVVNQK